MLTPFRISRTVRVSSCFIERFGEDEISLRLDIPTG